MDLELKWLAPFEMSYDSKPDLIYDIPRLKSVPDAPGVYVFARVFGDNLEPLYIGKAESLSRRIPQQLNNLKLMRGIERAPSGYRVLLVAQLIGKGGQQIAKAIGVIESAFISAALVEGFEILNKKGTKTLVHTITSNGNREARSWLPENTIKLRRA